MAITSLGFTSGDNYSVGMAKNVDAAMSAGGTSAAAQIASYEQIPATHGVSSTEVPSATGAGKGSVTLKRVSSPGPANASPSGPAPKRVI